MGQFEDEPCYRIPKKKSRSAATHTGILKFSCTQYLGPGLTVTRDQTSPSHLTLKSAQ